MTPSKPQAVETARKKSDRLARLRLLVVLDALLREGSVAKAAAGLGLQSSAVSRLLSQLREVYGDVLFTRTANGLVPTPFAERLRLHVRALVAETDRLIDAPFDPAPEPPDMRPDDWTRPPLIATPPLAVRPEVLLQGQPTPEQFAQKLANIGHNAPPQTRLAKYIATSASGPGQTRPLALDEADDALSIILNGEADPIQTGALFATMQHRGATAAEMAGLIRALRRHIGAFEPADDLADLDWPAYMPPKIRTPPWFLHAARLVAGAGYRVALHGHYGGGADGGKLELAAETAGIPVCLSVAEARAAIGRENIVYLPVGAASGQIQSLLALYGLMEMRLPVYAGVHLLNPLGAKASVLGVTTQSRRDLLRDTATMLGASDLSILGSARDFAEFTPFRATTLFRLQDGEAIDITIAARRKVAAPPPPPAYSSREYWQAVWSGAASDAVAEAIIVDTAAMALLTMPSCPVASFPAARSEAETLWRSRRRTS